METRPLTALALLPTTVLTYERTRQLRRWLDGVEEGGACAGSVPIR
ncbi:MAG TPA: hypothetical protein PL143_02675 [Rhodocyclaceae bacterium]|nr:hypothetical protein [Rhodocyclaceae bacterium]